MQILNRNSTTQYHLITCDHPFFVDAGLSSFTLPQIMAWWEQTDYRGVYVNQILFKESDDIKELKEFLPISRLLGWTYSTFDDSYSFVVDAWRYEAYNKGIYQSYMFFEAIPDGYDNVSTWGYYNNNPEARTEETGEFTLTFVDLNEFTGKTFDYASRSLVDAVRKDGESYELPLIFPELIVMNDYYNKIGFEDNDLDQARRLLLNDIRKSKKGGYVSWKKSNAVMYLPIQQGAERCRSDETFNFKLYLYSKKKPLNTDKNVAFPSLTIGAPAIGADGVNNKGKVDGDSDPVVDDSPENKVAGKIRTSYRPYDGTFSAGSEVRMAIVASDTIPGCSLPGSMADWAESMEIESHLANPEAQTITPGIGEVYSIDMQNGNPFQWTPNYSEPRGCRGVNREKVKLKVFNFNPKEFKRGDYVEIIDEYSLWCIKELAQPEVVLTPKDVGEWQFTYHITNSRYHFRYSDASTEGDYDSGFHENERIDDEFKMEQDLAKRNLQARNAKTWSDAKTSAQQTNSLDDATTWPGYAQITSFDYLGKEFCGLRGDMGNALVLTDNRKDHVGQSFESFDDPSNNIGVYSSPFFGCVFPEGYTVGDKYSNLNGEIYDAENPQLLTGKGWRPEATFSAGTGLNRYISPQVDLFFDRDMFYGADAIYGSGGVGFTPAANPASAQTEIKRGVFDPNAIHNNISTNYAPYYFLNDDAKTKANENKEPINLFSSESDFEHLPADVATNGSWTARNGGPILSLNKVQQYLTSPKAITYDQPFDQIGKSFHDFWLDPASYQWLYDTIDRENRTDYYKTDKSILDFTPVNNKRVLFRPLKDTVYCQWDQTLSEDLVQIPLPVKELEQIGFSNYGGGSAGETIGISNVGGGDPLFGAKTKSRIFYNDQTTDVNNFFTGKNHLIVSKYANLGDDDNLRYTDPDLASFVVDGVQGIPGMPFEYIMYLGNPVDKIDDLEYKTDGYAYGMGKLLHYGSNMPNNLGASKTNGDLDESMGGFGVIGARCTAIVSTGIQFDTQNYLGQPFFFDTATQTFVASWGGNQQLGFHQSSTTQLFVKAYQSWPRDQTIFDSRFFAVHHFSEGNRLPIGQGNKRPWEVGYRSGKTQTIEFGDPPQAVTIDPETQDATGISLRYVDDEGTTHRNNDYFGFDKAVTNVDNKIPSYFNDISFNPDGGSFTNGIKEVADTGRVVFQEGFVLGGATNHRLTSDAEIISHNTFIKETFVEDVQGFYSALYSKFQPLAPELFWAIDPDRRGRLLPWYQEQKTIGFGDIDFLVVPSSVDGKLFNAGGPLTTEEAETWNKQTLFDVITGNGAEQIFGNVIVQNPGTGYRVGERFKVQGGTGSSAEALVIEVGPEVGDIRDMQWVERDVNLIDDLNVEVKFNGKNYSQSDFPNGLLSGITTSTKSKISLVPASGSNRSFRASIMCGVITTSINVDTKPKIISANKEAYVLGANNQTLKSAGQNAQRTKHNFEIIPIGAATPLSFGGPATTNYTGPQLATDPLSESRQVTMELDLNQEDTNPNVIDGQADLFFQFHNDISHTKQRYASSSAYENFIDLSVIPF